MATKRTARDEIERLRGETIRTRRELGETWRALRGAWGRRRRSAGAAPEGTVYAGSKPERRARRPGIAAIAFGLAMVIPRMMMRRRSVPPSE
jgi:hypothetical protein